MTEAASDCIDVRKNDVGGTTATIGSGSNHLVDINELETFAGTYSLFVTKWYGQGGSSVDFAMTTESLQPSIVTNGVVNTLNGLPAILFSDSLMSNANGFNSSGDDQYSLQYVGSTDGTSYSYIFASSGYRGAILSVLPMIITK